MLFIIQPTYAFVYRWVELSTGKWYIGSRTRRGSHLNDGYVCSSRIVKPMIMAHRDNWVREILCVGLPNEMRKLEGRYLKLLKAKTNPMSYNRSDGTFSTIGISPWNKGLTLTDEKYKGGRKNKGKQPRLGASFSEESKKRMSLAKKGKAGPKKSSATKQKIKEANLGKKWAHNKKTKERKYVSPTDFTLLCNQGWSPGLGPKS